MNVLDQKQENWVYPCKPQFFYIKVGFTGVYISWTCISDDFRIFTMKGILLFTTTLLLYVQETKTTFSPNGLFHTLRKLAHAIYSDFLRL